MTPPPSATSTFVVDPGPEGQLVELPALAWMCGEGTVPGLGWHYLHGPDIAPGAVAAERSSYADLVLVERLRNAIERINGQLPADAVDQAVAAVVTNQSPVVIENHREFHRLLVEGIGVTWSDADGEHTETVKLVDWNDVDNNEFVVVNQFRIVIGSKNRRPDLLAFVNGIPLAEIECKAPGPDGLADEDGVAGVDPAAVDARNQIEHYVDTIPDLYRFVEVIAVTDLRHARVGTISTPAEHLAEWKTLSDDPAEKAKRQLRLLLEGVFEPDRLLDMIRNFVAFESDGAATWKVMAKYHQVHAVNAAIERAHSAMHGDRRGGLVWHTQGSGKSLTMTFFVTKLRRDPRFQNPTVVMLTDRTDLDNQLAQQFERLAHLAPAVMRAGEIKGRDDSLYKLLDRPVGGIIFTTIQKFQPPLVDGRTRAATMPVLSDRANVIVIADEAHRSQYGPLAQNITVALPNAVRVGFTGTPVELSDRSTRSVFGDYVSIYRMRQAQADHSTVPIYYESRMVPVDIADPKALRDTEQILETEEDQAAAELIRAWAQLEQVVGTPERIERVVADVVKHFSERRDAVAGKAMVVAYSRRIAAEITAGLQAHFGEDAVTCVISAQATDPPELSKFRRSKAEMKQVAKEFKDPDHPLQIVVVKDMWLTGFDAPVLGTLYIDKPMRDHGLLQAIARVNRVFRDKPGGMVVDYIGIGDDLRASLKAYDSAEVDDPTVPVALAVARLQEKVEVVAAILNPAGYRIGAELTATERAELFLDCYDLLVIDDDTTKGFLDEQAALKRWYALCKTEPEAIGYRDDVEFAGSLTKALTQNTVAGAQASPQARQAVKQFFSEGLGAGEVVDVFGITSEERPEISVLSDEFLDQIGSGEQRPNLRIRLLEKLLADEIKTQRRTNGIQAAKFGDEVSKVLKRYELRQVESADVIRRLVEIAKAMREARHRHEKLGLTPEEAAFYDALAGSAEDIQADPKIAEIAAALVRSIRADLTVDWTDRESTTAKIRMKIKHLLRSKRYTPPAPSGNGSAGGGEVLTIDRATDLILSQAKLLYRYYPDVPDDLGRLFTEV